MKMNKNQKAESLFYNECSISTSFIKRGWSKMTDVCFTVNQENSHSQLYIELIGVTQDEVD